MKKAILLFWALALVSGAVHAQICIDFNELSVGTEFGSSAGDLPGDVILAQDAITVAVDSFFWTDTTGAFNFCQAPDVGTPAFSTPFIEFNNISLTFDFSGLGFTVGKVRLKYRNWGGFDNLQVNGGPLHISPLAELPVNVAPGVFAYHAFHSDYNYLTLIGEVNNLTVGGQELWMDDVCAYKERVIGTSCLDFNEMEPGTVMGAPVGHLPDELFYIESNDDFFILSLDSFYHALGSSGIYNFCTINGAAPPAWPSPHLQFNNINMRIAVGVVLANYVVRVTFKYRNLGGVDNFSVQNGLPYIGPLYDAPADIAPDFQLSHSSDGEADYIVVEGYAFEIMIGGQELLLDDVCFDIATIDAGEVKEETGFPELFPNPARKGSAAYLHLGQIPGPSVTLDFFDSLGRLVKTVQAVPQEQTAVSLNGLEAGIYFYRIRGSEKWPGVGKIVVSGN